MRGVGLVQRNEARHIAFGVYLLARLVAEQPALRAVIDTRLNELLPQALAVIDDVFPPYGDDVPLGLDPTEMLTYAGDQFDKRMRAIKNASCVN